MRRLTRQEAINAKCKDCIYDELEPGTWKQQTEACTITGCSLWPYRPLSEAGKRPERTRDPDRHPVAPGNGGKSICG